MKDRTESLADRLRDLRRRHFGASGRDALARSLRVSADEVERWERGTIPPGETLVRICELTGEDLQWLLTGAASRSTVVISGARNRHRDLLTRIASALEGSPALAAPLEAFFDLLTTRSPSTSPRAMYTAAVEPAHVADVADPAVLIPILELAELSDDWDRPNGPGGGLPLASIGSPEISESRAAQLLEPATDYAGAAARQISLVRAVGDPVRSFVRAAGLVEIVPGIVAVRWLDESMSPMFAADDALLVARDTPPVLGQPALVKLADQLPRCRVWLGEHAGQTHLGRVSDGAAESVSTSDVRWSVEVLYRVRAA